MERYIYKIERLVTGQADYAIRYTPDGLKVFAKIAGGAEFATNFKQNAKAFNLYLDVGAEVPKDEYDAF